MFYLTDKNYIIFLFPSSVTQGGRRKGQRKKEEKRKRNTKKREIVLFF